MNTQQRCQRRHHRRRTEKKNALTKATLTLLVWCATTTTLPSTSASTSATLVRGGRIPPPPPPRPPPRSKKDGSDSSQSPEPNSSTTSPVSATRSSIETPQDNTEAAAPETSGVPSLSSSSSQHSERKRRIQPPPPPPKHRSSLINSFDLTHGSSSKSSEWKRASSHVPQSLEHGVLADKPEEEAEDREVMRRTSVLPDEKNPPVATIQTDISKSNHLESYEDKMERPVRQVPLSLTTKTTRPDTYFQLPSAGGKSPDPRQQSFQQQQQQPSQTLMSHGRSTSLNGGHPRQNRLPVTSQRQQTGSPPQSSYRPSQQVENHPSRINAIPSVLSSSSWKSIWSRVEQGLDSLVDLEGTVATRAHNVVSKVASSTTSTSAKRLFQRPGRRNTRTQNTHDRHQSQQQSSHHPQGALSRLAQDGRGSYSRFSRAVASVTPPTSQRLTPYGQKYDAATLEAQKKKQQVGQLKQKQNLPLAWTQALVPGGAAPPPNDEAPPTPPLMAPPRHDPQKQQQPPPPQTTVQSNNGSGMYPSRPQNSSQQQSRVAGQQQQQQAQQAQPPRPPQQQSLAVTTTAYRPNVPHPPTSSTNPTNPETDSNTRTSRIPWDRGATSSASTAQQPTPPTKMREYQLKESSSWASKLGRLMPSIPKLSLMRKLFRRQDSYRYASMDAWKNDEEKNRPPKKGLFGLFSRRSTASSSSSTRLTKWEKAAESSTLPEPLENMMSRCQSGKVPSLLSPTDIRESHKMGRVEAVFDFTATLFLVAALQQMPKIATIVLPSSLDEVTAVTLPLVSSILQDSMMTWAPLALAYAYLTQFVKRVLLFPIAKAKSGRIADAVRFESSFSQLYVRLCSATPVDNNVPERLARASSLQMESTVALAKLTMFVTLLLLSLVALAVAGVRPILSSLSVMVSSALSLPGWTSWPPDCKLLSSGLREIIRTFTLSLSSTLKSQSTKLSEIPVQRVAFYFTLVGSLLGIVMLPKWAKHRRVSKDDVDENDTTTATESFEELAKMGSSSAIRLSILSENGSIESALQRWSQAQVSDPAEEHPTTFAMMIRRLAYSMLGLFLCIAPIMVASFDKELAESTLSQLFRLGIRWHSPLDMAIVFGTVWFLLTSTISTVTKVAVSSPLVQGFVGVLSKTVKEVQSVNERQVGLAFMSSVSPSAGLQVQDLWAAHKTKRAWAVRGANLHCKNGEVLVVLGDDGAGKSRMLTAIAESLLEPPLESRTSSKVRGSISVGGVESSKWNNATIKRRLGVLLSDVRTVADCANLFSGSTLEEILDPVDGTRNNDPSHTMGSSERSSILLALKVTGLYSTLIPKLPSKLATVVTANEDELRPSAFRPRSNVLSPSEWSKLLLTKVLAQTIYDNDNSAASTERVESSLVGSILMLDDATALLSEVEEAKIITELRRTGAATLITSNKWATGRFGDHIVVIKDGSIVEHGTHNDLLARGPQQSLYAAKWQAMTMQ